MDMDGRSVKSIGAAAKSGKPMYMCCELLQVVEPEDEGDGDDDVESEEYILSYCTSGIFLLFLILNKNS